MSSIARVPDDATELVDLHGARGGGRARRSPSDPRMALLTIFDPNEAPSAPVLETWMRELRDRGYLSVRTGAVTVRAARQLERHGFHVVQKLLLLSLVPGTGHDAGTLSRRGVRTTRLRRRRFADAAAVDHAAFPAGWAMDAAMIEETCRATPLHRARAGGLAGGSGGLHGYAVFGRSGRHGFVQRLAVHPDAQRSGVGATLLRDGLRWLRRWRAEQVFVNTQVGNEPALSLYLGAGFTVLPEGLHVMERACA